MRKIAEYIVDKLQKKGAKDVVVTLVEDDATQVKFSNNKISIVSNWKENHMSIFTSVNKKTISTSLKDFTTKGADECVEQIINFANAVDENNEHITIATGPFTYRNTDDLYDKKITELDTELIDLVEKGINAATKNGAIRSAGLLQSEEEKVTLITSNGVDVEEQGTELYYSIRAFADKDATGHIVNNARNLKQLKIEQAATVAAITAKNARNPVKIEPGKYDILFEPLPASNILENVGNAASIFNIEAGLSCLNGKLGKKIANENITFSDDPTLKYGIHSRKFDAEGVPTQKNTIIEKGILKTYLHNTSTAIKHKTKTTANAGIISPTPFNLVLEKGNLNKETIISEMKKGIIVTNVWYTRFQNYSTGDFSTIPRDAIFFVEKGKITKPVKDIRISDNILNIINNTTKIGNIPLAVKSWENEIPVTTPAVLAEKVNITKSVE